MTEAKPILDLRFPFATPPSPGEMREVAPGLFWLRLALPFRLNHVNIYLVEDGAGYALVDTGIADDATRHRWDLLLEGFLRSDRLTRIIATHFHPDHVGMAGSLCQRLDIPLMMSETEYLNSLIHHLDPNMLSSDVYRGFYRGQGMDAATTDLLLSSGHRYLKMVTALPRTFHRLVAGETLQLGRRQFAVLTGGGHSPEQVMLHCEAEGLLLGGDQVLARISPNISVQAMDPEGDPLGIYLRSLAGLRRLPSDTLVLPGHDLPFFGLHARLDALAAHHADRCNAVYDACRDKGRTAADLLPVVFRRSLDDPHQVGFAFSEVMAHINLMLRQGRLGRDGGHYRAIEPPSDENGVTIRRREGNTDATKIGGAGT